MKKHNFLNIAARLCCGVMIMTLFPSEGMCTSVWEKAQAEREAQEKAEKERLHQERAARAQGGGKVTIAANVAAAVAAGGPNKKPAFQQSEQKEKEIILFKPENLTELLKFFLIQPNGVLRKPSEITNNQQITQTEMWNLLTSQAWNHAAAQSLDVNGSPLPFMNNAPSDKEIFLVSAALNWIAGGQAQKFNSLDSLWNSVKYKIIKTQNREQKASEVLGFYQQIRRFYIMAHRANPEKLNALNLSNDEQNFLNHVNALRDGGHTVFTREFEAEKESTEFDVKNTIKRVMESQNPQTINWDSVINSMTNKIDKDIAIELINQNMIKGLVESKVNIDALAVAVGADLSKWNSGGEPGTRAVTPPPPAPPPPAPK